jgi:hypothetical protein
MATVLIGFSNTTDPATLNAIPATLAARWTAIARDTRDFAAWYNDLDLPTVEQLFALQPDHASAESYAIGLMTTLAGIFFGLVQQGGTGGTGASLENFEDGLRIMAGPGPAPGVT